jgi:hypothetical protein
MVSIDYWLTVTVQYNGTDTHALALAYNCLLPCSTGPTG